MIDMIPHTRNKQDGVNGDDDARILQLSEIIVAEMRATPVASPPAPKIYRVPEPLLAADKAAYHRGDSDSATEDMRRNHAGKPRNMDHMMERTAITASEKDLDVTARSRSAGGVEAGVAGHAALAARTRT